MDCIRYRQAAIESHADNLGNPFGPVALSAAKFMRMPAGYVELSSSDSRKTVVKKVAANNLKLNVGGKDVDVKKTTQTLQARGAQLSVKHQIF